MCEDDSGCEFLAGWIDGSRAARWERSRIVRRELRRFGLTLDEQGAVVDARHSPATTSVAEDDPHHEAQAGVEYRDGFEQGFDASLSRYTVELRRELIAHGLFLTSEGTVSHVEVVDQLAQRFHGARPVEKGAVELTDAALHAFLDDSGSSLSPHEQASTPEQSTPRHRGWATVRMAGACSMVLKRMKRRTALVAVTGMVATAVTVGLWPTESGKAAPARIHASSAASNAPWANLPPRHRVAYDALEQWASSEESRGGQGNVALACQRLMATPLRGSNRLFETKCQVLNFINATDRFVYLPALMPLFAEHEVSKDIMRWNTLIIAKKAVRSLGPSALSEEVRKSLSRFVAEERGDARMREFTAELLEMR